VVVWVVVVPLLLKDRWGEWWWKFRVVSGWLGGLVDKSGLSFHDLSDQPPPDLGSFFRALI